HVESKSMKRRASAAFAAARTMGLSLPDVEATTRYDGSPVLKVAGVFMAGIATHCSAEPDTLVVRTSFEEREWLLEDAPDTYYITDFYRRYPLVLVRLSAIDRDALRDVLSVTRQLTLPKTRRARARPASRRQAGAGRSVSAGSSPRRPAE